MAARIVRRTFASPFVVTLAAALPAAACYVQPAPARSGGGGGAPIAEEHAPNHSNPPRATGQQIPNEQTPDHSTTNAGAEQAPPANTTVVANPPRPKAVAKQDLKWTVTKAAGKCTAFSNSSCPPQPAGQPIPPCNPPPPIAYTCLPNMADNESVTVAQYAGQSVCQIEYPAMKCPAGAICNPPRPQKAACPQ